MHRRIAGAIKRARGKRSAQWLADRTAALGYPITRAQIANYESGRKQSLDIAELLVLAAALNVPPVMLLYPGPYMQECELLPGVRIPELVAVEWVSGHRDWRIENADITDAEREESDLAERNSRPLYLHREYFDAVVERNELVKAGEVGGNDRKLIELYDKRIRELSKEIESLDV